MEKKKKRLEEEKTNYYVIDQGGRKGTETPTHQAQAGDTNQHHREKTKHPPRGHKEHWGGVSCRQEPATLESAFQNAHRMEHNGVSQGPDHDEKTEKQPMVWWGERGG